MNKYKIGRYYIENIDHFRENTRSSMLERSTCLVLNKISQSENLEVLEVNVFNIDAFGRYYTSGINTITVLNELGITVKRRARINEIFEFWIGLRIAKDDE